MRKIKFRVFDKGLKIIHYLDGKDPHDDLNFFDGNVYYYNLQNGCGSMGEDSEYVLMQFTGLLDKNGKEIYEGDVVKNLGVGKKEVKWSETNNGWNVRKSYSGINYHEIIGNIYENPLLIN